MAALNDTPLANDRVSDTQAPIRENFNSISTAFNLNHGNFGAGNEGKHLFLQMPEQGAAPATLANEAALYAAVGATSTVSELVFRRESNGSTFAFTECNAAVSGWTRLPSGIMLKWGQSGDITGSGSGSGPMNVAFNGPAFSAIYSVTLGVESSSAGSSNVNAVIVRGSLSTTDFDLYIGKISGSGDVTANIRYMAIGLST